MAGPSGVLFMGHWRAEKGHHAVPGKLVDCPLMLVDFVHQDFEAAIHDLVDFLGIKLFRKGSEVSDISEKYGHQLPLAFDSASVC
jgi:hypothetical protein